MPKPPEGLRGWWLAPVPGCGGPWWLRSVTVGRACSLLVLFGCGVWDCFPQLSEPAASPENAGPASTPAEANRPGASREAGSQPGYLCRRVLLVECSAVMVREATSRRACGRRHAAVQTTAGLRPLGDLEPVDLDDDDDDDTNAE